MLIIGDDDMPRPCKFRRVGYEPSEVFFKPRGVPLSELEIVNLKLDELEAMRLADIESLYHEDAAKKMGVSRQTFDRIVQRAHTLVAQALVNGKAIHIEGGNVMVNVRTFICSDCQHRWSLPMGTGKPGECPGCKGANVHRAPEERGTGAGGQGRCGAGLGMGGGMGRNAGAGMGAGKGRGRGRRGGGGGGGGGR